VKDYIDSHYSKCQWSFEFQRLGGLEFKFHCGDAQFNKLSPCIWISLLIKFQCKKMLANFGCANVTKC
jgi:hypothetical protein